MLVLRKAGVYKLNSYRCGVVKHIYGFLTAVQLCCPLPLQIPSSHQTAIRLLPESELFSKCRVRGAGTTYRPSNYVKGAK